MKKPRIELGWTAVVLAVALLPCVASRAETTGYSITKVADTVGRYDFFGGIDVNAAGTVVFKAAPRGGGRTNLYTASGGKIRPAVKQNLHEGVGAARINDAGILAFNARLRGVDSILTCKPEAPVVSVADTSGPFALVRLAGINSAGTVVFIATLKAGGEGLYTGGSGVLTTIADSTKRFSRFDGAGINAAGVVAFEAKLKTGEIGIYTSNGGVIKTISESSVDTDSPGINADGMVVFRSLSAICTGNGGKPVTIAAAPGVYSSFGMFEGGRNNSFQTPGITDQGTVVFAAQLAAGGAGLFTGPDPKKDCIIATGDLLFGVPLRSIRFFGSVSSDGKVAFGYDRTDEVSGIALAVPVREPTTLPTTTYVAAGPDTPAPAISAQTVNMAFLPRTTGSCSANFPCALRIGCGRLPIRRSGRSNPSWERSSIRTTSRRRQHPRLRLTRRGR